MEIERMKEAKRQAEAIEADKRQQATMDNLAKAAENKKQAAKDLDKAMKDSKGAIELLIASVPREHKQTAINTQNAAIKLIAKLKAGADVNDIVRQLNELKG